MKKKLVGIVGSYRKIGNAEIVAKAIGEKLGNEWNLSFIRLPQLKILPCKGCYACLQPGTSCNLQDDMAWLLERLCEADALVFAAPNYILGPIGMIKMLTDRALQAMSYGTALWKKRAVVALTLGREEYRGYADTALTAQVAGLGLDIVGVECFYGTHPGEVALVSDFGEKIGRLSDALLGNERVGSTKIVAQDAFPTSFGPIPRASNARFVNLWPSARPMDPCISSFFTPNSLKWVRSSISSGSK
jgi:multimeric flavodoxin WrbA